MDKAWKELHANPPEGWREYWNLKQKIYRCDTQKQADIWRTKLQKKYEPELLIKLHVKDGYVIYHN